MIVVIDVDASKVIEAVRSTGVVITRPMIEYAHYLISNMKNIGTWQLSNAVYGFVGGTADSHKWNWKDLRDVDAAYRLVFNGGWIHSSTGATPNGTTGYADTFYIPTFTTDVGFGMYSGSNVNAGTEISLQYPVSNAQFYLVLRNGNSTFGTSNSTNPSIYTQASNTLDSRGYFFTQNNGSTNGSKIFIRGSLAAQSTITKTTTNPTNHFIIGARRQNIAYDSFSTKRNQFTIFTNSYLTDTQAIQQSQIVTNAQHILNRA